jgi:hypothetical protein
MLRYSKERLESCSDQLLWNAVFAAFNVSARNIYCFLKNKDSPNVRLRDFEGHYGTFIPTPSKKIEGTYQKLNAQCAHMGKQRTKVTRDKITLERLRTLFEWANSNMEALIQSLDLEIDVERADPIKQASANTSLVLTLTSDSATNNPILSATTALPGESLPEK